MTTRTMFRLTAPLAALAAAGALALAVPGPRAGTKPVGQVDSNTWTRSIIEVSSRGAAPRVKCIAEGLAREVYAGLSDDFRTFSEDERCRAASLARRMQPGGDVDAVLSFARSSIGGLEITSDPAGAAIWVNGFRLAGSTGMRAITTAGEKTVRLSLDGFQEDSVTVLVEPGRWTTLHRELKR